jgi:hypothetical protein
MNSTTKTRPRQAWPDVLLMIAFGALLWLPTVDYFGHVDWTPSLDENRLPAPRPRLTGLDISGAQNYLAATEAYFDDHFGFRRRLVRWCQQWKERIFRGGRSPFMVTVGRNGWLYLCQSQMIEHFLGLNHFTPQQLRSWQRLLEKRRDWLAARGIKYLFVVPPDKQSVYPENLPAWLLDARPPGCQTKLDQFVQYMKADSTVEIVDLRQLLIAGKKVAPTYLQNDTHWSMFGAFIAGQEVIQAVSRQLPGLPPLKLEDFYRTNAPGKGGDLARVVGTPEKPEQNLFRFAPKPPLVELPIQTLTNLVRIWNPGDKSKVNCLVENTNLAAPAVDLVVFHDSFAAAWWNFFGYSFHRTVFVWENQEFNARVITEYHPQIVINEMLERFLNTEDPDEMLAKDALP